MVAGFLLVTLYTLILLFLVLGKDIKVLIASVLWIIGVGLLGHNGFFSNTDAIPPRLPIVLIPTLIAIAIIAWRFPISKLNRQALTAIHIVRIPVEIYLFWLYKDALIPKIMTFEGANYDILMGITAIVILVLQRKKNRRKLLLIWNIIGLVLLLNIVIIALLSAPLPMQTMSFDQPNVGVLYFPYCYLPAFIVPAVMLSHFLGISIYRKAHFEDL